MRSNSKTVSLWVILVLVAMSAILTAVTAAIAQPGDETPFTGVWETVSGSATRYSVELTQIGNKVTGTFTPGNGKIFGGIVIGNKLTFNWTQDGGASGTGEFTLDADRKGFTGSSTSVKPSPVTHPWKTFDPGPPSSFAGSWETKIGFRTIQLSISQKGDKVTGIYLADNGTIQGTVAGRLLRFKWESDKGSGSGEFNISSSGESFGGTFNKGTDPKVVEGYWNGTRQSGGTSKDTDTSQDGDTGIDETTKGGTGGKIMASYAGSWLISEDGVSGGMDLAQSGPTVTGYYATSRGDYELKDGQVNGTIFRFKLVPRVSKPGGEKVGEVVMDPDGKSFKGTIGDLPVTGTFARP